MGTVVSKQKYSPENLIKVWLGEQPLQTTDNQLDVVTTLGDPYKPFDVIVGELHCSSYPLRYRSDILKELLNYIPCVVEHVWGAPFQGKTTQLAIYSASYPIVEHILDIEMEAGFICQYRYNFITKFLMACNVHTPLIHKLSGCGSDYFSAPDNLTEGCKNFTQHLNVYLERLSTKYPMLQPVFD